MQQQGLNIILAITSVEVGRRVEEMKSGAGLLGLCYKIMDQQGRARGKETFPYQNIVCSVTLQNLYGVLRTKTFTSLKADLHQDINGGFAFSHQRSK